MIILDREAGAATKDDPYSGITLRHPSAAFTRSSSLLLPDYNTSEALHWKDPQQIPRKRPRLNPQIWKAAGYAFAIYMFLSLVIVLPLAIIKMKKQASARYKDIDSFWANIDNADPPSLLQQLTASGTPVVDYNNTCNRWTTSPLNNTAHSKYYLPSKGVVTVRSNATYNPINPPPIFGNLMVQLNKDPTQKNIAFDLGLTYSSTHFLEQTFICFSPSGPTRGLSIYVPSQFVPGDRLVFNISVFLPQVKSTLNKFITYLPMIEQTFGDLGHSVVFEQIILEGAGQPIISKHMRAQRISVRNLAAPIEGTYNVTNSLVLDSVKGHVLSNITLTQPPNPTQPTLLEIGTGDSEINANVVLDSSKLAAMPRSPAFGVQVNNFNGPTTLNVSYSQSTANTTMQLTAQNNLAPTTITLDPRYQGNICAKNKLDAIVVQNFAKQDPAGTQRSWTLDYSQQKEGYINAWAGWGPPPMRGRNSASMVDITSSLSPVFLNFGTP